MSRRVQRVEKELQQIIASFLLTRYKGELRGMVSISRVEVSPDLRSARAFVSVLAAEGEDVEALESENLEILQERSRDIQFEVSKQLPMKFCPKIKFFADQGLKKSFEIQKILSEVKPTEE